LPSLSVFIGSQEETGVTATEETSVVPEEADAQEAAFLSIQTGSYSVRENAEYALKDLKAAGFSAEIRERTIGDTVYYRVIIPDIGSDDVEKVILELKEKGFEGFRVYE
jgi:cell division protein FtsN